MNGLLKKTAKISTIYTGIAACLAGLVILVISVFSLFNYKEYDGKTTATISYIKKEVNETYNEYDDFSGDKYNYTVYVDYKVDNKEYKNIELGSYDSSMKEGKTVEIKYDLNDPSNIQTMNGNTFIIIFIVIGALGIAFGIYQIIKGVKINKENPMYSVLKD